KDTERFLTNSDPLKLTDLNNNTINEVYPFYMEINFDYNESIYISKLHGIQEKFKNYFIRMEEEKFIFENNFYDDSSMEWQWIMRQIKSPENIKVIFASESKDFLNNMDQKI